MTVPALRPEPRTSAADADGGHGGRRTRCRGVGNPWAGSRAHPNQTHTHHHQALTRRVLRASGSFVAPSPSFPALASGR